MSVKRICVSEEAYNKLKTEVAKDSSLIGRGIVGYMDRLLLGKFTTDGSGGNRWESQRKRKRV